MIPVNVALLIESLSSYVLIFMLKHAFPFWRGFIVIQSQTDSPIAIHNHHIDATLVRGPQQKDTLIWKIIMQI